MQELQNELSTLSVSSAKIVVGARKQCQASQHCLDAKKAELDEMTAEIKNARWSSKKMQDGRAKV
jgi:hypothetical protein